MLCASLGCWLTACNSSSTWGDDPNNFSGAAVKGFSLKANAEVLNNLDSVYFSIDLMNARIFNASPLPVGTDVSAIAVDISSDACSVAELQFINDDNESQTVDYLANSDVKINFTHGPATLHLVSFDGTTSRDYKILLNVATEKADSLYWDKLQGGNLVGISELKHSKTVKLGSKALMLSTNNDGSPAISTFIPAAKTGGGTWNQTLIYPSFDVNRVVNNLIVESFTSTDGGELFVIDTNGNLFRSTDSGNSFKTVDTNWISITAPYLNGVLGVKRNATDVYASYPASMLSVPTAVASDFPVGGINGSASVATIWAANPQVVVTGGKTHAGNVTGATWAFDGSRWAKVSDKLPAGTGYNLCSYTICETDTTSWRITQRNVIIAFGGCNSASADSEPDKTVYISRDMGVNWQKGSELLQLPDYIPFTTGGSLMVFDKELEANAVTPMAVAPITSWNCPYIYLFGGYDLNGEPRTKYWSGVVNHLKLKPLQ